MSDGEPFIGYDEHGNPVERSGPPRVGPFIGYDARGNPSRLANPRPASGRRRGGILGSLLALLVAGALIGGWIALRNNGLLGGLDHHGPLEVSGLNDAVELECGPGRSLYNVMRNHGGGAVTIDDITPNVDSAELDVGPVVTYVGPPHFLSPYLEDPRSPAGLTILPGAERGFSYTAAVRPSGIPKYAGASLMYEVPGVSVNYHSGARHFRATGGILTQLDCPAKKSAPQGP